MRKVLFIIGMVSISTATIAAQVCFEPIRDFDAPYYPAGICTADFNGDSFPDLATANDESHTIIPYLGNGDGTFTNSDTIFSANPFPGMESICAADFNNDGFDDITVFKFKFDTLSIYFNNGDGTFDAGIHFKIGPTAGYLSTKDFNEDGFIDIALERGLTDSTIYLFLNTGASNFSPPGIYACANPGQIWSDDVNNDSHLDLISGGSWHINVFLGTGNGTFGAPIHSASLNHQILDIKTGDFNEDGKLDFVTAGGLHDSVYVHYGDGNGGVDTILSQQGFPSSSVNRQLAVTDFDHDGHLDVAAVNYVSNDISVFMGDGAGTFHSMINFFAYSFPFTLVSADFNGDTYDDIAFGNQLFSLNNSGVLLTTTPLIISADASPDSICSGDPVILTGGGATSYVWDNLNNSVIDSLGNSPIQNGMPYFPDSSATYIVTGTTGPCYATATITVNISPVPTQDICVISTDSSTASYNVVVWEKPDNIDYIDSFFVYREITLNVYQKVGAVHKDSLSLFNDFGANPNTTSYKYKITAMDVCGNEGPRSLYHNSIHLQYLGLGNFQWTYYDIESAPNPVSSYNFYRDDNATGNFQLLNIIPGGNHTYTDVNYNSFPSALYRVDLTWTSSHQCTSTRTELSTSRSNIKGQVQIGINENDLDNLISISPNPSSEIISVSLPLYLIGGIINFTNGIGEIIETRIISSSKIQFDISSLRSGMYFINLQSKFGNINKKIIKY